MFGVKHFKKDTSREIELMNEIAKAKEISLINNNVMTEFYYRISVPAWAGIVKKWVPPKDEDDVEDPFQDGWIKILDKRKTYKKNSKPYLWCFTIIKNTVYNFFQLMINKSERIRESDEENDNNGIVLVLHGNLLAADFLTRMNDIERVVNDIIENEMQPLERKAIKLLLQEYKQREIAKELNISVGACNKAIKHARNVIKNSLERKNINIEEIRYE